MPPPSSEGGFAGRRGADPYKHISSVVGHGVGAIHESPVGGYESRAYECVIWCALGSPVQGELAAKQTEGLLVDNPSAPAGHLPLLGGGFWRTVGDSDPYKNVLMHLHASSASKIYIYLLN